MEKWERGGMCGSVLYVKEKVPQVNARFQLYSGSSCCCICVGYLRSEQGRGRGG